MTYSPVPTVVTGDTWTAAQHNTYIRDNFAALHPYTARGDIAYRNNAGNIARLALGDVTKCLKSYGGDPAYMGAFGFHAFNSDNQSISNNTLTQLTFNMEIFDTYGLFASNTLTVPNGWGGLWITGAGGCFQAKASNNGGLREIVIDGVGISNEQTASFTQDVDGSVTYVNVVMVRYFAEGDTVVVKVLQKSGGALNFSLGNFWGCKLA